MFPPRQVLLSVQTHVVRVCVFVNLIVTFSICEQIRRTNTVSYRRMIQYSYTNVTINCFCFFQRKKKIDIWHLSWLNYSTVCTVVVHKREIMNDGVYVWMFVVTSTYLLIIRIGMFLFQAINYYYYYYYYFFLKY